jgi:hypothetical protein
VNCRGLKLVVGSECSDVVEVGSKMFIKRFESVHQTVQSAPKRLKRPRKQFNSKIVSKPN